MKAEDEGSNIALYDLFAQSIIKIRKSHVKTVDNFFCYIPFLKTWITQWSQAQPERLYENKAESKLCRLIKMEKTEILKS